MVSCPLLQKLSPAPHLKLFQLLVFQLLLDALLLLSLLQLARTQDPQGGRADPLASPPSGGATSLAAAGGDGFANREFLRESGPQRVPDDDRRTSFLGTLAKLNSGESWLLGWLHLGGGLVLGVSCALPASALRV